MFSYQFKSKILVFVGPTDWYFVDLPKDISEEIKDVTELNDRGFGAVRVSVKLGESEWQTSIFPQAKKGQYMLPLKKTIRKENDLDYDDDVEVEIKLLDY